MNGGACAGAKPGSRGAACSSRGAGPDEALWWTRAIAAAMENLYRLPERTAFMIKTQYYYSEKQDADSAMAVLDMWTSLYPDDVDAHVQQALFRFIRQDIEGTIASYQRILEIDPSRSQYLE